MTRPLISIVVCLILMGCSNSKIRYSNKTDFETTLHQDSIEPITAESKSPVNEVNSEISSTEIDSILQNLNLVNLESPLKTVFTPIRGSKTTFLQDAKADFKSLRRLRKEINYPGNRSKSAKKQLTAGIILLSLGLALEILFVIVSTAGKFWSGVSEASSAGCAGVAAVLVFVAILAILGGLTLVILGSILIHRGRGRGYPVSKKLTN